MAGAWKKLSIAIGCWAVGLAGLVGRLGWRGLPWAGGSDWAAGLGGGAGGRGCGARRASWAAGLAIWAGGLGWLGWRARVTSWAGVLGWRAGLAGGV